MSKITSLLIGALVVAASTTAVAQWGAGWNIPAGAEKETMPTQATPAVLEEGKKLFDANCAKCHGERGLGDGPASDARTPAADLTDPFRAELNPDGVVFYRITNGKPPAMPAFNTQMTPAQIWSVVAYAKSLRKEG